MTLHVICVAYNRTISLGGLIDSFIVQTDPRWKFHIIHDGLAPLEVKRILTPYKDEPRVNFEETPERSGCWGHYNRRDKLQEIITEPGDYILMTNDDNYYVPVFVQYFLNECLASTGMVYCDTIHSYIQYDVFHTRPKVLFIDMGSFMVRSDVAKVVGFIHDHPAADGEYAEECATYCHNHHLEVKYIAKAIYVHN